MDPIKTTVTVAGKEISFESGKIARQANGSVIVRCGETMVLATACSTPDPLPDVDFLPLRVDYQEKFSSVGKTPSGFIKREGRPAERETLTSRLIDRPIRPMIKEGYYHDIQLLSYVLSYDAVNSPDVLAICAASAALCLSDIPLIKPIGAVRVGFIQNTFVVNPTVEEQKVSTLDLILAGTEDAVLMIEGSCQFLSEEQVLEAIETGHKAVKDICQCLGQLQKEHGKEKRLDTLHIIDPALIALVEEKATPMLRKAAITYKKKEREKEMAAGSKAIIEELTDETKPVHFKAKDVKAALETVSSSFMRKSIFDTGIRWDGRKNTEIRPISIEQGLLPRAHGSSLFTRGETQSIAICVLGGEQMAQRFEDLHGEGEQRFYMQYFFPPFSVGEVGRVGSPGRREIGHGKLAERALAATLPSKELFPYIIRLESNITESNGSSSMASVCGGCLALMEAGVPIQRPVAGIAMGLLLEKDRCMVLSDILGLEDALGDMDFKVTGDHLGITAFQMDIKVEGITIDIMRRALGQAKEGRIHILNKMLEACPKSKPMSTYAPRIETMQIKPSKIGLVIGPGGKQIRAIVEETGVEININDNGTVSLSSTSAEGLEKAKQIIHGLTAEAEIGKTYSGKIVSIVPFGFFVEILPGKEGLCHISELDVHRIEDINEYAKEKQIKIGDEIQVLVTDINDRGQLKLSRKALLRQTRPQAHPTPAA
jgi:polyribonucleotide nucleotidyltransferase